MSGSGGSREVVEQTPLCVWCGVGVMFVGGHKGWVHEVNARSNGGQWCVGSIVHTAAPTEWVDGEQGWVGVGYMTAEEARVLGGW